MSSSRLGLDAEVATGEFLALLKDAKEGTLRRPPPDCLSGVIGESRPGISRKGRCVEGLSEPGVDGTGVEGRCKKSGSLFDAQYTESKALKSGSESDRFL